MALGQAAIAPVAAVTLEGDALSLGLVQVRHTGTARGFGVFAANYAAKLGCF